MWAMIEKLRMRRVGVGTGIWGRERRGAARAWLDGVARILSQLFQAQLPGHPLALAFEDEVDALPNVLGHGHLGLVMQELEQLVLLRRDVDGGGDLLPRHRAGRPCMTIRG